MSNLIVLNNPDTKRSRPDVVEGHPLTVMFGNKKLTGATVKPYSGEKVVVLHGRQESRITLSGLYMRDGVLHCRWVD